MVGATTLCPMWACDRRCIMAKIGTAHVEIKPVLNEEALREIEQRLGVTVDSLSGFQLLAAVVADLRDRIAALERK